MMSGTLFETDTAGQQPLAYSLAPKSFSDYMGHEEQLGPDTPLRRLIESDQLSSLIIWGPPGCGKTALSRLIATYSKAQYITLNAVMAKVADIRNAISQATQAQQMGQKTILFIDEIHRFNKSQQDALLPDVEKGTLIMIGATTENPYFSVNGSLLSRAQLVSLSPLSIDALTGILNNALTTLNQEELLTEDSKKWVVHHAKGDARRLLNLIERLHKLTPESGPPIEKEALMNMVQQEGISHSDDAHYDIISALIKSVRGSDPDAAIYWLARLIKGGEDPRFIARRLLILASEDIGNADPQALTLATACLQTVQFIGLPEAEYALSQVTLYLATAPKSNATTIAIGLAKQHIDNGHVYPVPHELRDTHYPGAKKLGHGDGYDYAHTHKDGISTASYLPERHTFYTPVSRGFEATIEKRLNYINNKRYGQQGKKRDTK